MSAGSADESATATVAHPGEAPSVWVRRWSHLVQPGATVLDVACGSGRHLRWFVAHGCRVTGIDRDATALSRSHAVAECIAADIEADAWPLHGRRFDAVVVTNYLWRPGLPDIIASVAPGGLLVYETFAAGQETIGRPSNPNFLLEPGELMMWASRPSSGLRVIAFEDGFENDPTRFVQRIVAVREPEGETVPRRHALARWSP